jgi:hypothetical protein
MLALKLLLVPAFLLAVSLAGRRWGAAVAGSLAGLPVVGGPILFFLALDHGPGFAAGAAVTALSAVFASVAFSLAYAHVAQRKGWGVALLAGLGAWTVAALLLARLPGAPVWALVVAVTTLCVAPTVFPTPTPLGAARAGGSAELVSRMVAGALLTLAVTTAASRVGPTWSGLLTVFPLLGIVLAVFSHRHQGAAFTAVLLRAMVMGQWAFAAFCVVLAWAVPWLALGAAFAAAVAASLVASVGVQLAVRRRRPQPLRA